MAAPLNGPCTPWTSADAVLALPWVQAAAAKAIQNGLLDQVQIEQVAVEAATAASEVLYELSGRMFTGQCGPVTIRPVARPTDADTRGISGGSPLGWFSSSMGAGYGFLNPGVLAHYGPTDPPTIRLPYPVTSIVEVLIDGVVIPTAEYELRDFQELVRIRPTASTTPTQMWGWPTSQIMDLPDSQPGTFSVTIMFGNPAPVAGQLAARKLAEYLLLPQLGDSTRYPARVVQMSRQGVTTQVASVIDVLAKRSVGIWEVDTFLLAVNPGRNRRQGGVWSPDIGRNRRQAIPD